MQELPPPHLLPPPLSEYEKQRMINITLNDQVYKMLKLPTLVDSVRGGMKKSERKVPEEGSEYVPEEETIADDAPQEEKRVGAASTEKSRKVHFFPTCFIVVLL